MDDEHEPRFHTIIEYWVRCKCGWIHCTDSPEAALVAYDKHLEKKED